jgi:hypothetical protein
MALYSLFERIANRQYKRLSEQAYSKHLAVRIFQDDLLNGSFSGRSMCLRPVRGNESKDPLNLCTSCQKQLHTQHIRSFGCKCNCTMINGD